MQFCRMEFMAKIRSFSQLNDNKRCRLEALIFEGHNQKSCAQVLKVDEGTISREIGRYSREDGIYDAEVAIHRAMIKRSSSKYQGYQIEKNPDLKKYIIKYLKKKRSPDEISGRMKRDKEPFYASKNAIYSWLWSPYGQKYCKYLCTKRYSRKPQNKEKHKREMIPNLVSFRQAPLGSLNKTRYGNGEVDTIVSPKKSEEKPALAVVTLKKEKLVCLRKIENLKPDSMVTAVKDINEKTKILSLIADRGIENKKHQSFGVNTFFCDAHSPWQKPHVENQNGLLRRWWFPKGTRWSQVSEEKIQKAENHLNNKWRKSLGYMSAFEVALAHGIIEEVDITS
jgi:IS30 family transposase